MRKYYYGTHYVHIRMCAQALPVPGVFPFHGHFELDSHGECSIINFEDVLDDEVEYHRWGRPVQFRGRQSATLIVAESKKKQGKRKTGYK